MSVLDQVNEWSTHSMISHGPWGNVSHATSVDPGSTKTCSSPLNTDSLTNAQPGASQMTVAAAFIYFFGGNNHKGTYFPFGYFGSPVSVTDVPSLDTTAPDIGVKFSGSKDVAVYRSIVSYEWYSGNNPNDDWGFNEGAANPWQEFPGNSNRGAKVSDYILNGLNYYDLTPKAPKIDPSLITLSSYDGWLRRYYRPEESAFQYDYSQYMNIGNVNLGDASGRGVVCSTFLSYAARNGGAGGVTAGTYSHDMTINGIGSLWNYAFQQCNDKLGFLQDLWCTASTDVCRDAANQIVNTFVSNRPLADYSWQAVYNTNAQARSVSPDCLAGVTTTGIGCFSSGGGASPWGWGPPNMIQWSSPGDTFACWD